MTVLGIVSETFSSFREAADTARALAMDVEIEVSIRWNSVAWDLIVRSEDWAEFGISVIEWVDSRQAERDTEVREHDLESFSDYEQDGRDLEENASIAYNDEMDAIENGAWDKSIGREKAREQAGRLYRKTMAFINAGAEAQAWRMMESGPEESDNTPF